MDTQWTDCLYRLPLARQLARSCTGWYSGRNPHLLHPAKSESPGKPTDKSDQFPSIQGNQFHEMEPRSGEQVKNDDDDDGLSSQHESPFLILFHLPSPPSGGAFSQIIDQAPRPKTMTALGGIMHQRRIQQEHTQGTPRASKRSITTRPQTQAFGAKPQNGKWTSPKSTTGKGLKRTSNKQDAKPCEAIPHHSPRCYTGAAATQIPRDMTQGHVN